MNKNYNRLFFLLLLFLTVNIVGYAQRTYYVTPTGTGDGTSWSSPSGDLQAVMKQAQPGESIWVAKGTYIPQTKVTTTTINGNATTDRDMAFVLPKDVKIYGGFNGNETSLNQRNLKNNISILSGEIGNPTNGNDNCFHVVIAAGNVGNTLLDGFTITNGNASILNEDSVLINGKAVRNNRGGGLFLVESSPIIQQVIIKENEARLGAGIFGYKSGFKLIHSKVIDNISTSGGGAGIYNDSSNPMLTNILIAGNADIWRLGQMGGGIHNVNSSPIITNATIVNNTVPLVGAGGVFNDSKSNPRIYNSIIWGNVENASNTPFSNDVNGEGNPVYENSLVGHGRAASGTLINGDPLFVDFDNKNYELQLCSPAINKGNSSYSQLFGIDNDLNGNSRIFENTKIDMGAYEYQEYTTTLTPDANGIIYVNKGNSFNGNGSSWNNAVKELSDALLFAQSGCNTSVTEIWVAKGTYIPQIKAATTTTTGATTTNRDMAFVLPQNVKIYGGFNSHETSIDERDLELNKTILSGDIGLPGNNADNCYHVVIGAGNLGSTLLDGFTIMKGNADQLSTEILVNGKSIKQYNGGGIYLDEASPEIRNVIITENLGEISGGAIYSRNSSFRLLQSEITDNVSTNGGAGIYNESSAPTLTNILIAGNNNEGRIHSVGAGIHNNGSSPIITNVTITNNTVGMSGAGGIYSDANSNPQIRNSIIWGNKEKVDSSTPNDNDVYKTGSSVYENSLIGFGESASGSLINGDPLFVDFANKNYKLQACSPAVNKGDNSYPQLAPITSDLSNNFRIFDNTKIDMGAYEYQGYKITLTPDANGILYVDNSIPTSGDGSSWNNAVKELADAMLYAQSGCNGLVSEIWVKKGTYYPIYKVISIDPINNPTTDRDKTFVLPKNVKIYGGFTTNATSIDQRDIKQNKSILSGDIGVVGDNSDNSYHVIIAAGYLGNVVLDGFIIQDGNADEFGMMIVNDEYISQSLGGGIMDIFENSNTGNTSHTTSYSNIEIRSNYAAQSGGGAFVHGKTNSLFNKTVIDQNTALTGGGVSLYGYENNCTFVNSLISNNEGEINGGAFMMEANAHGRLINSTIVNNKSDGYGPAIFLLGSAEATLSNSILWSNTSPNEGSIMGGVVNTSYSIIEGEDLTSDTGSFDGTDEANDPTFDKDFTLTTSSPLINKGNNALYNKALYGNQDLNLRNRVMASTIDLGAFETKELIEASFVTTAFVSCIHNPQLSAKILIKNGEYFPFVIKYNGEYGNEETITINDASVLRVESTDADGNITYAYHLEVSPSETTRYTLKSISEGTDAEGNKAENTNLDGYIDVTINAVDIANIEGETSVFVNGEITLTNATQGGTWSSSDENIATVLNGVVKGISAGNVTIEYSVTNSDGCTEVASYNIIVNSFTSPSSISAQFTSQSTTLCAGGSAQVTVVITDGIAPYTLEYKENNVLKTIPNITTDNYTFTVMPASTTTYTLVSVKDAANNEDLALTSTITVTVTSAPSIGNLSVPAVTCPGNLLSVSIPAHSNGGSAILSAGWTLNGNAFNPATDVVGLDDNGKKLAYWITNACGTATSNEVAIVVSNEVLKVQDIGSGCNTVVDLNMAVVSKAQGSTVQFFRSANDTQPIQNPTAVAVSNSLSTTFYAKAVGGNSRCVTSEMQSFNVTPSKATQKITFEVMSVKLIGSPDFDPMATASSGLQVTYTSSNPEVAIIVNGKIHIVGVGVTIITASQAGDDCFLPAEDVSRELNVIDLESGEDLTPEVEINGELWPNLDEAYIICESNITSVLIKIKVPAGATVDKGLSFTVEVTEPGIKVVQFTVTSKDGKRTETFKIYIDKRIAFESIVKMRWNNTFAVINNPANNGGYSQFVAYKWYRNEQVVGEGQYYSVNNSTWDKLNPQDRYFVEVETIDGKVIRTCLWKGILDDFSVSAYPNPVQKGGIVYVEATMNEMSFNNASVELYTLTGGLISKTKVTGRITEIPMNENPGTYLLKFIGDNDYVRSFKVIIKE